MRVFSSDEYAEIWWDTKAKTLTPHKHNKPDIVQSREEIFYMSVGLDVNPTKNFNEKRGNYLPLAAELKWYLYIRIIPIVIRATG